MKVYQAINAVQADLAKIGISKDSKNQAQGYAFRGIDAVYGAVSPLLAKHHLCILPRVTERTVTERQNKSGTALFYVTVRVEFDLVEASDGSKHTVIAYGEAMDSGDKATNKAMSAAYKYACLQTFCIPTEGDNDPDASTHEVISEEEKRTEAFKIAVQRHAASVDAIKSNLDLYATANSVGEAADASKYLSRAAEAWGELDEETKEALWRAPSKGGCFSTIHRATMKTPEFRMAHTGAAR